MSTKSLMQSSNVFPSHFDDFFRPWGEWFANDGFAGGIRNIPSVNIIESNDSYQVSLAAPGLEKNDFRVDIDGNIITIRSEKEEKKEEKEKNYTRKEYNFSSFSRSFTLPADVKQDKIEAAYVNGVLKLSLPKKEDVKKLETAKHIPVK